MLPRAPLVWAGLALLGAAALVYYWPARTPALTSTASGPAATVSPPPAADAPRADPAPLPPQPLASAAGTAPEAASSAAAPSPSALSAASAVSAASAAQALPDQSARPANLPPMVMPSATGATVAVSEPVWLEVTDASGQVVFQRTIQPGETLTFDQTPPLRLKIGNSTAAKLTFRGEPVDLNTFTRGNVARVTLK